MLPSAADIAAAVAAAAEAAAAAPLDAPSRRPPLRPPLPPTPPAAAASSADEISDRGVRGDGEPAPELCAVPRDRGEPDIIDSREVDPDFVPRLSLLLALPASAEPDPPGCPASKSWGKATWTSERAEVMPRSEVLPLPPEAGAPAPDPALDSISPTSSSTPSGANPGGASSLRGEVLPAQLEERSAL